MAMTFQGEFTRFFGSRRPIGMISNGRAPNATRRQSIGLELFRTHRPRAFVDSIRRPPSSLISRSGHGGKHPPLRLRRSAPCVRGRTTPLSNGLSLVQARPSTINPQGVRYASVRPLRLCLRGDRGRARTRRRLSSGDGPRPKTGASRCRRISPSLRITPSISPAR
jgi:hypothetical protein